MEGDGQKEEKEKEREEGKGRGGKETNNEECAETKRRRVQREKGQRGDWRKEFVIFTR